MEQPKGIKTVTAVQKQHKTPAAQLASSVQGSHASARFILLLQSSRPKGAAPLGT